MFCDAIHAWVFPNPGDRFDRHTKARVKHLRGRVSAERTSSDRLNGLGPQTDFCVVVELPVWIQTLPFLLPVHLPTVVHPFHLLLVLRFPRLDHPLLTSSMRLLLVHP